MCIRDSNNHALISANALINAELVGAYGHGLSRLKMYCERISKKVINPKPKIKVKKIMPESLKVEANCFEISEPKKAPKDPPAAITPNTLIAPLPRNKFIITTQNIETTKNE